MDPEWANQEVRELHDRLCQAGMKPDLILMLYLLRGWGEPRVGHTSRIQSGEFVYEIRRIA